MVRKGRVYRLTVRFDLPMKDKRYKNDDTSASTLSHTSLSLGRQNGEKGGREARVSRVTAFMDYTFKSPWRQEISTAKIQITGEAQGDNGDY